MKQFFSLAFAAVALAQTPTTLQVDVNNFVLYNYDTFDMDKFGTNGAATNIMMKTYNFHVAIGDITAVSGTAAKGTLLCGTMPMFVLSPNPTPGTQAMADTSRSMIDQCSVEIMTSAGACTKVLCMKLRKARIASSDP